MSMPKFSVLNAVEEHLIEKARNNDRNFKVFHPSAWDGCHRKIAYEYYEAIGAITLDQSTHKIDPQLERIFDNGHFMHDRWGIYLEKAGILKGKWRCQNWLAHSSPKIYGDNNTTGIPRPDKCECGSDKFKYVELGYFDEETNWSGHVDAIVMTDGDDILVDFKTMNPFQFNSLKAPLPKHLTQMQIYFHLSGLKYGKFIYEDKGSQKVKEFDVERDDDLIAVKKEEAILLKYQVTHLNSKGQRVLPSRRYFSAGQKECLKCKFRGHCWGK